MVKLDQNNDLKNKKQKKTLSGVLLKLSTLLKHVTVCAGFKHAGIKNILDSSTLSGSY